MKSAWKAQRQAQGCIPGEGLLEEDTQMCYLKGRPLTGGFPFFTETEEQVVHGQDRVPGQGSLGEW